MASSNSLNDIAASLAEQERVRREQEAAISSANVDKGVSFYEVNIKLKVVSFRPLTKEEGEKYDQRALPAVIQSVVQSMVMDLAGNTHMRAAKVIGFSVTPTNS